jgi:hypothetical protein
VSGVRGADVSEATISISPIEVLVLKKLVIINHALGKTISGQAGVEQLALTQVLNDITLRADVAMIRARAEKP